MKNSRFGFARVVVAAMTLFLLPLALLAPARADILYLYLYSTTLAKSLGPVPDTSMLNGAAVQITFNVPDAATYVDRFGLPAVPVLNPMIAISNSGIAANNGTFALDSTAFFPFFQGGRAARRLLFRTRCYSVSFLFAKRRNSHFWWKHVSYL